MTRQQTVRVHLTETDLGNGRIMQRGWENMSIFDAGPQNGYRVVHSSIQGTLVWLDGKPYHNTQGQTEGIGGEFATHAEAQAWLDSLPVIEVPVAQPPARPVRPAPALAACAHCGTELPRSLLMGSSISGAVCPDCYDDLEPEA